MPADELFITARRGKFPFQRVKVQNINNVLARGKSAKSVTLLILQPSRGVFASNMAVIRLDCLQQCTWIASKFEGGPF